MSTSFTGDATPPEDVIRRSDFVLLHGSSHDAGGVGRLVAAVRSSPAYAAAPKPIVVNEDSTRLENFAAAVEARASWGYYDQGANNYTDGFQSPPVNWRINTPQKRAFFGQARRYTVRRSDAMTRVAGRD